MTVIVRHAKSIIITVMALGLASTLQRRYYKLTSDKKYPMHVSSRLLKEGRRAAIAALVPNTTQDLSDFCYALRSLEHLKDVGFSKAPVLVFHEQINVDQQKILRKCTDRTLTFELLSFELPPGFDPEKELKNKVTIRSSKEGVGRLKRQRWGYNQMIRFWTSGIYKHPSLDNFETVMRIDTDSCFNHVGGPLDEDLPSIPDKYVYRTKPFAYGSGPFIEGLYDLTVSYMKKEGITPANPDFWNTISDIWRSKGKLITMQTNFEVARLSFFRREDVAKWHEALTEHEPWGVFRYRWGDAQTRALTLAMFAKPDEIMATLHRGYVHGRDSSRPNSPSFCHAFYDRIDVADQLENM